jgi:hypothetical protein
VRLCPLELLCISTDVKRAVKIAVGTIFADLILLRDTKHVILDNSVHVDLVFRNPALRGLV